jgi:hypothetical protein
MVKCVRDPVGPTILCGIMSGHNECLLSLGVVFTPNGQSSSATISEVGGSPPVLAIAASQKKLLPFWNR